MRRLRFSKAHGALCLAIFVIEVLIALYMHDTFVRGYVGDALVVVLVYTAVLTLWDLPRVPLALAVFAFAGAIELGQGCDLVNRLSLGGSRVFRVIIGTSFDLHDFLAYAAGTLLIIGVEQRWASRA